MRKLLSIALLLFPALLPAQDIGNVGLRTVGATLANGTSCTGAAQNFITNSTALNALGYKNLGQTSHLATATSNAASFTMEIDGLDTLGNVFRLSDLQVGVPTSAKGGLVVTASGWMPNIQVSVTCTAAATFSLSYSGSFSPVPPNLGGALLVATDKLPFQTAAANTTASVTFQSPSGNSAGTIVFQFTAAGPAGSSITAQCLSNNGSNLQAYTFQLTTVTTAQLFNVTQSSCPFLTLTYTSGGASATTYNLEYVFNQSGTAQTLSTANSGPSSTSPTQVVSDSLSQAFYNGQGSVSNPASLFVVQGITAGNGARSIYFDKLLVTCSAACTFNINTINSLGSGCGIITGFNAKLGAGVTSTASGVVGACTTAPNATSLYQFVNLGAGASITIDLRGVIAPSGTQQGLDVVVLTGFTGNINSTFTWYEK